MAHSFGTCPKAWLESEGQVVVAFTLPPEDGSFQPTLDNEPGRDDLYDLWEFVVLTNDNRFLVDPETNEILHFYDEPGGQLGIFRWKNVEIREYRLLAPELEDGVCSRFTLWAWAMNEDGITGFHSIGEEESYDSAYEAMRHGWYYYFHSLRTPG